MTYEAHVPYRNGEKKFVWGQALATVTGDTCQIQASPAPTFTLLNEQGTVLLGPVAVTGYNNVAAATPLLWYLLDSTGLNTSVYSQLFIGQFSFAVTDIGDGLTRPNLISEVAIEVLPAVESVYTFDLTTPIGQVRLQLMDLDPANPILPDSLINQQIAVVSGGAAGVQLASVPAALVTNGVQTWSQLQTYYAASLCMNLIARRRAYLARMVKTGIFATDTETARKACLQEADRLFKLALAESAGTTVAAGTPIPTNFNSPLSDW